MLLNAQTAVLCSKVLLVPYKAHHVPTYHDWMQDEVIRNATSSERLTLEEEYEMQLSWGKDFDKLTFIICTPPRDEDIGNKTVVLSKEDDTPKNMVGDINLFLSVADNGDQNDGDGPALGETGRTKLVGELELMIARKDCQGKGFGRASLLLFLWYILMQKDNLAKEWAQHYDSQEPTLCYVLAKIHSTNERSIKLFESLSFKKKSETPNYFGEFVLVLHDLDIVRIVGLMREFNLSAWKVLKYI